MADSIGIFDSGVGGLTAVRALNKLAPQADLVFFGDTARVPYGGRSNEELTLFAGQNIALLREFGATSIVAACCTISSILTPRQTDGFGIPFTGMVQGAADRAAAETETGCIGILGTAATVRNRGFEKNILSRRPNAELVYSPCPLFVSFAERGIRSPEHPELRAAVREYLAPILASDADVLILGCTHYPLLRDAISAELDRDILLIDCAEEAAKLLLQGGTPDGTGKREYYVSGDPESFAAAAEQLLGSPIGTVRKIDRSALPKG